MKISLISKSILGQVLESGLSLIKAYFPEAQVHLEESPKDKDIGDNFDVYIIRVEHTPSSFSASWEDFGTKPFSNMIIEMDAQELARIKELPDIGKEERNKNLLKLVIFKLLSIVTGKKLPWGILTGIRPTKLIHKMDDMGLTKSTQEAVLKTRYAVSSQKIDLLRKIVDIQRPYLNELKAKPKVVSVYVGIPFCPSRCSYCTFPGYPVTQKREGLRLYLEALGQEINALSEQMVSQNLKVDNLYIGGGTPTILLTSELEQLLGELERIPKEEDLEFTIEAGRPDTISREKLLLFKERGVNRLSINPQTMQNKTLRRIGRNHSVKDFIDVYEMAREVSDWIINMDLILGLPGETSDDVKDTLEQIRSLNPDNLTVHVLALKKGSREKELGYKHIASNDIEDMQTITLKNTREWGLLPYYLYRQKHIAGNLENIGYAFPDAYCRYNISIMEERQSIIGLGAGSNTKIVNPLDYSLENLAHSYNWEDYRRKWQDLHKKRWDLFNVN